MQPKQLANAGTPAPERDRLTQDQTRRRAELQQLTSQANTDFAAAQTRLQTELRGQLTPILADIAKQRGVDAILNGDTIAWAAPATDVTNEVLQRLNAPPQ
jgi:Skp family chaperone for outer membrane proteins